MSEKKGTKRKRDQEPADQEPGSELGPAPAAENDLEDQTAVALLRDLLQQGRNQGNETRKWLREQAGLLRGLRQNLDQNLGPKEIPHANWLKFGEEQTDVKVLPAVGSYFRMTQLHTGLVGMPYTAVMYVRSEVRLLWDVVQPTQHDFVSVAGPPGSGKSIALFVWAMHKASTGSSVAWLKIGQADYCLTLLFPDTSSAAEHAAEAAQAAARAAGQFEAAATAAGAVARRAVESTSATCCRRTFTSVAALNAFVRSLKCSILVVDGITSREQDQLVVDQAYRWFTDPSGQQRKLVLVTSQSARLKHRADSRQPTEHSMASWTPEDYAHALGTLEKWLKSTELAKELAEEGEFYEAAFPAAFQSSDEQPQQQSKGAAEDDQDALRRAFFRQCAPVFEAAELPNVPPSAPEQQGPSKASAAAPARPDKSKDNATATAAIPPAVAKFIAGFWAKLHDAGGSARWFFATKSADIR